MIDKKIKEYAGLKRVKTGLESRLSQLNHEIKKELLKPKYAINENTFTYLKDGFKAEIKVKSLRNYDPNLLEDLLWKKGLWEQCTRRVIDESFVEQAYLSGDLTDDDLRSVKVSKFQTALTVGEEDGVPEDF